MSKIGTLIFVAVFEGPIILLKIDHWVHVISMSTTDKELLFPFLCAKCIQKGCIKLEN